MIAHCFSIILAIFGIEAVASATPSASWIFSLSNHTPALINYDGTALPCKQGLHKNSRITTANGAITASICLDHVTNPDHLIGIYTQPDGYISTFIVYRGQKEMQTVLNQIFPFGGLVNGVNGTCQANATALLSITGTILGDVPSARGYCLFDN